MNAPNPVCVDGFPGIPANNHAGEREIRMIKHIEKLRFQPQLGVLRQGEILGKVEVIPDEIRPAQGVAAEVSELAGRRAISANASAGAGVNGGGKGIGIEPLNGAGLRHPGNGVGARYKGTPGTTLANCGPLPCTMPFPFAEYGVLKTEKGIPLCQNAVPETCHPFSAYPSRWLWTLIGNSYTY